MTCLEKTLSHLCLTFVFITFSKRKGLWVFLLPRVSPGQPHQILKKVWIYLPHHSHKCHSFATDKCILSAGRQRNALRKECVACKAYADPQPLRKENEYEEKKSPTLQQNEGQQLDMRKTPICKFNQELQPWFSTINVKSNYVIFTSPINCLKNKYQEIFKGYFSWHITKIFCQLDSTCTATKAKDSAQDAFQTHTTYRNQDSIKLCVNFPDFCSLLVNKVALQSF